MRTLAVLCLVIGLLPSPMSAEDVNVVSQRALVLTLEWTGDKIEIQKTDKAEHAVPPQNGFPQLKACFYELSDQAGDVHYSGTVLDPRPMTTGDQAPPTVTSTLVIPDLPEARTFKIYRRNLQDPDAELDEALKQELP